MQYHIQFQYKGEHDARPEDCAQNDDIRGEGEPVLIPMPGDSVQVRSGGKSRFGKVLTRHFSYIMGLCLVNIVFTDIDDDEMEARIIG